MILAIIQARLGSTRYPNKIFCSLANKPLIWHIVNRLKYSKKIDDIVIATTNNVIDDQLSFWAKENGLNLFRGSENNVLERFYLTAKHFAADIIVRITADDPFKDPNIIDSVIEKLLSENLDFAYNNYPPTYPEGLDTEVFTYSALEKAYKMSTDDFEKEHVTQFFYKHPSLFRQANISNIQNLSYLRWTIDTEKDYQMARTIYNLLYVDNEIFLLDDILKCLETYPEIEQINKNVSRSDMYKNT